MQTTCLELSDVAAAIGIEPDALAHWVYEGWLPTHGGSTDDRQFDLVQVIRFIRQYHLTVRRPDALGLNADPADPASLDLERQRVERALRLPDHDVLSHLLISRYAIWERFADYLDDVVEPLVRRRSGRGNAEAARQRCVKALQDVAALIHPTCRADRRALVAPLEGVGAELGPAMAAVVLGDMGYQAHNPGPDATGPAVARIINDHAPHVVVVDLDAAVTVPAELVRERLSYLAARCQAAQARLLVLAAADNVDDLVPDGVAHLESMGRLHDELAKLVVHHVNP